MPGHYQRPNVWPVLAAFFFLTTIGLALLLFNQPQTPPIVSPNPDPTRRQNLEAVIHDLNSAAWAVRFDNPFQTQVNAALIQFDNFKVLNSTWIQQHPAISSNILEAEHWLTAARKLNSLARYTQEDVRDLRASLERSIALLVTANNLL